MVNRVSRVAGMGILLTLFSLAAMAFQPFYACGGVFGRDVPANVFIVEDSSEALCLWHAAGMRDTPLITFHADPGFFSAAVQFEHDLPRMRAALEGPSCEQAVLQAQHMDHEAKLYGKGDFIFAAFRLGIVRELWWVVPAKKSIKNDNLGAVKERLRDYYGLPGEFIESLTHDGQSVRGNFQGLPVRILSLTDLPVFGEPVLLSVDAEWFVNLYQNPVKESMLDLVGGFFKTLQQKKLPGDVAVIARSVRDGSTPLHFRYLAGYVRDFLARPGEFAEGPPSSWRLQGRIEYLDFMLARDEALADARRLSAMEPHSPVPWYDLAYISASRGDVKSARTYLGEAARRDRAYAFGYISISDLLADRPLPAESLALLEDGHRSWPADGDIARHLGKAYGRGGRYQEADDLYADLLARFPGVPDMHADYAAILWMKGERKKAEVHMKHYRKMAHPGMNRNRTIRGWEAMKKKRGQVLK
jgi:tetratricopeptide (TPR) repeat protein